MILFNSQINEWAWLSNMWLCKLITKGGHNFRCVEIYYQWQKVTRPFRDQIFACRDGFEAKRLARTCDYDQSFFRERLEIMYTTVRAKFKQNPKLLKKLIETGDELLVEYAPWGDKFWGVNKQHVGENHMGQILMRIREEFRT